MSSLYFPLWPGRGGRFVKAGAAGPGGAGIKGLQFPPGIVARFLDGGAHELQGRLIIGVAGGFIDRRLAAGRAAGRLAQGRFQKQARRGLPQIEPVQAGNFLGLVTGGAAALMDRAVRFSKVQYVVR